MAADGDKSLQVVPLSAANEARLSEYAATLLRFIEQAEENDVILADVARTYQAAREPLEARYAFLASTFEDLAEALRACLIGEKASPVVSSRKV